MLLLNSSINSDLPAPGSTYASFSTVWDFPTSTRLNKPNESKIFFMLQGFVVKQRLTGSQLFFMINYYSAYLGVSRENWLAVSEEWTLKRIQIEDCETVVSKG